MFIMMNKFGYSMTELEQMISWERELYSIMVIQEVEKEVMKKRHEAAARGR